MGRRVCSCVSFLLDLFLTHARLVVLCLSNSLLLLVPGIYLGVPAIFCLYAQGKTNGVVLDSGECVTSAIPVFDGYAIAAAAQQVRHTTSTTMRCALLCCVVLRRIMLRCAWCVLLLTDRLHLPACACLCRNRPTNRTAAIWWARHHFIHREALARGEH